MIAGLILAGGKASRMGGIDKPLLDLAGQPIIAHLLGCLRPQVGQLAISANGDPARYEYGLTVLADEVTGRGPLGGVLRGLQWAGLLGATALLTVPGDTPFVPADLAIRLGTAPACAENAAGLQPLIALWPVSCAPVLAAWLGGQESGRVRAFGALIGMRLVWFEEAFVNINSFEELEGVRKTVLF